MHVCIQCRDLTACPWLHVVAVLRRALQPGESFRHARQCFCSNSSVHASHRSKPYMQSSASHIPCSVMCLLHGYLSGQLFHAALSCDPPSSAPMWFSHHLMLGSQDLSCTKVSSPTCMAANAKARYLHCTDAFSRVPSAMQHVSATYLK